MAANFPGNSAGVMFRVSIYRINIKTISSFPQFMFWASTKYIKLENLPTIFPIRPEATED